jgi:hypothetical protein
MVRRFLERNLASAAQMKASEIFLTTSIAPDALSHTLTTTPYPPAPSRCCGSQRLRSVGCSAASASGFDAPGTGEIVGNAPLGSTALLLLTLLLLLLLLVLLMLVLLLLQVLPLAGAAAAGAATGAAAVAAW